MTKQEVLSHLGISELPAPAPATKSRCAVLVQRTTGQQDYAIWENDRVVMDINYRGGIAKVIEFYPAEKEKPAPVTEPVSIQTQKNERTHTVQEKDSSVFNRKEAVLFLRGKKVKSPNRLPDYELKRLLVNHGQTQPTPIPTQPTTH